MLVDFECILVADVRYNIVNVGWKMTQTLAAMTPHILVVYIKSVFIRMENLCNVIIEIGNILEISEIVLVHNNI